MRPWIVFALIVLVASEFYFESGGSYEQSCYRRAWLALTEHQHFPLIRASVLVRGNDGILRREDPQAVMTDLGQDPGFLRRLFGLLVASLTFGILISGTAASAAPGVFAFDASGETYRRGAQLIDQGLPDLFAGHRRVAWIVGALLAGSAFALGRRFSTLHFHPFALGCLLISDVVSFGSLQIIERRRARRSDSLLQIGHLRIPAAAELYHFLVAGRTGAGKTQAIQQLLRTAERRGDQALIADPDGGYFARFGRKGDLLLNPFDSRSLRWSPFAEIRSPFDYDLLATAIIPPGNSANDEEWRRFARVMLSTSLKQLHCDGRGTPREMLRLVNGANDGELQTMLAGTSAAGLHRHEAMFHSILGVITPHLQAWEYLKEPDEEHPAFSVRQWVRDACPGWLFLPYRDDQIESLKHLIATWTALAVAEALSLPEDLRRRIWFVIDELDSLGKVASMKQAATKLRKHGGVMVAGLQTIAQLRATYGHDEAQVILSSLSNKLILAMGDHETARYFQDELGQRELIRHKTTKQRGRSGHHASDSKSESRDVVLEHVILASELQGLGERCGFLRCAGDTMIHPVRIPLVPMPSRNRAFVAEG